MNFINKHMLLLILLLISACSSQHIDNNNHIIEEKIPLNLPNPNPLQMQEVEWKIVNKSNVNQVINKNGAIIGLTLDDYQVFSNNMIEVQYYIIGLQKTLQGYRDYYEPEIK